MPERQGEIPKTMKQLLFFKDLAKFLQKLLKMFV